MKNSKEKINFETGEITEVQIPKKLNEVVVKTTKRADGTLRIQQDFSYCPTMAEQHTAHLTNINYLMEKMRPDEIAAYVAARATMRPEITGHDFSQELSLQDASNVVYACKKIYEDLSDEVKRNFRSPLEFIKFIDNPGNQEKMANLGLITKKQIQTIQEAAPTKTKDDVKEDVKT